MTAAHVIPFTLDPFEEYDQLCHEHEALIAHIQRVVPEMRDSGDIAGMLDLECRDAALRERIGLVDQRIRSGT
ncbi:MULTISPECIES: hypothetical protein [Deinococcus]|uniref:DUF465 domain-containing protein n=1 Tax=Deinococcus rufus TaxID=2136097 RepID=A0ABV7Z914_9DEIO|nr:hypothetical protein [Deinococcus sp. AB2017081]WQE97452.1 hypothetical protein U2P90_20060 [Deinococcus sp. AB2017081]WQE97475.1 hypothetical protein U2P90_19930 [Deinococcus sp. AB2017081]